jgi:hypothetical protein
MKPGDSAQNPLRWVNERYGDVSPIISSDRVALRLGHRHEVINARLPRHF